MRVSANTRAVTPTTSTPIPRVNPGVEPDPSPPPVVVVRSAALVLSGRVVSDVRSVSVGDGGGLVVGAVDERWVGCAVVVGLDFVVVDSGSLRVVVVT